MEPGTGPRASNNGCGETEAVGGGGKRCDTSVLIRCKMKAGLRIKAGRR